MAKPSSGSILVVDQFEELFTLCRDEGERGLFIDRLLAAASNGARVIAVLRADFYGHAALYPRLAAVLEDHQALVGPMTEEELRRAIERPAEKAGLLLEPGLVEAILHDVVGEPGALPLLSHSLLETWKRRSGRMLTLIGYLQAGGVRGAIAKTADTVYYDRLSAPQQELARNVFLRLTELGEGTEDTRRRVHRDELIPRPERAGDVDELLRLLVDARLVTTGEETVEVAHEALIRHWPTLRAWLDDDRESRLIHRRLTEAAHEWEALGRDPGALYRGARLAAVSGWAEQHDSELNELEREYVREGVHAQDTEKAEEEARRAREAALERRSLRRLRTLVAVLGVAALVAAGLTIFAFRQSERSTHEARIATAGQLTAASVANLTVDPERSILLALRAAEIYGGKPADVPRDTVEALHRAIEATRVRLTIRDPATGSVAFSPDGTEVAGSGGAAAGSGSVAIWDARTGKKRLALPLRRHVNVVRFSPDGSRLYTEIPGVGVAAWSIRGRPRLLYTLHDTGPMSNLAVSGDGRNLAVTAFDGSLTIWGTRSRRLLRHIHAPSALCAADFSHDSTRIAAAGCYSGDTGRIWSVSTGKQLLKVNQSNGSVITVAFSPDGQRLATAGIDGKARVWDAHSGRLIATLEGHTGWVFAVAFSPDGRRVATGSADGTARIWTAATGRQLLVLAGHTKTIYDVAFSKSGRRLLTGSADGTARIWDISAQGGRDALTIPAHGEAPLIGALTVAYTPDGTRIVTGGGGTPAALWDSESGARLRILPLWKTHRRRAIQPRRAARRTRRRHTDGVCRRCRHRAPTHEAGVTRLPVHTRRGVEPRREVDSPRQRRRHGDALGCAHGQTAPELRAFDGPVRARHRLPRRLQSGRHQALHRCLGWNGQDLERRFGRTPAHDPRAQHPGQRTVRQRRRVPPADRKLGRHRESLGAPFGSAPAYDHGAIRCDLGRGVQSRRNRDCDRRR